MSMARVPASRAVRSSSAPSLRRGAPALAALTVALTLAACGSDDDGDGTPPPPGTDILEQLRAAPGVASVEELGTNQPGARYFELYFDQPVDHANPGGGRFLQQATLLHRDAAAPMVLAHTGYGNWIYDYALEPTRLLGGNQLAVEHRFFRSSRPDGGPGDWDHLTIEQAASDHHRIVVALQPIYEAAWIETGASKGGMTSVYHRRFYPDDVDGTVAYVAPLSLGAPDYRYEAHVEALGPAACRQALRDLQVELLTNRRDYVVERAIQQAMVRGHVYHRVELPVAVESSIIALEWSFWQARGATRCSSVPPVTASDEQVWAFLDDASEVASSADANLLEFEPYYYQADVELGFPGTMDEHLEGLLEFPPEAYAGAYPPGVELPAYRPEVMADIDAWVRSEGERLVFVYGEWDPWTGGMFELGDATDSLRVVAPRAPHGAGIDDLGDADNEAVRERLEAWTGVELPPTRPNHLRVAPTPPAPRLPSVWVARRLRATTPDAAGQLPTEAVEGVKPAR